LSIGIVIKGPEGLVLAADSRVTLQAPGPGGQVVMVNYDNAHKVLSFPTPHNYVGAVTYGLGGIGLRSAYSFIPEFWDELPPSRLPVGEFAKKLSDFFLRQWRAAMPPDYKGPSITFVVAGFDEKEPYGRVYLIEIPTAPDPIEQYASAGIFGVTWGGQREIVDRLMRGYDERVVEAATTVLNLNQAQADQLRQALDPLAMQVPIQFLPLQDCIDLAVFFIRTTIEAQRLTVGIRGCGGAIDIATITRLEGLSFIQSKQIRGETGSLK